MTHETMAEKLRRLEIECEQLRSKLTQQTEIQSEVESLKEELEKSLETHKNLQQVALAFEEENRGMQEKYNTVLRDRAQLDALKIDLQHEIETKTQSYTNLDKRYNKLKEKMDNSESVEDLVYNLEKDKRRNTEKIEELQEELEALRRGQEIREKEKLDRVNKLTKENTDMAIKLETYIEEMEEMDSRVESLEKENKELLKQNERAKTMELFGSHTAELVELEVEKEELAIKLEKEMKRRENVETELFKVEEEFENYKLQAEQEELQWQTKMQSFELQENELLNFQDDENVGNVEVNKDLKNILRRKQIAIGNLEGEKKELINKIQSLEQEREILLEENSSLAKANMNQKEKNVEVSENFKNKINQLEEQMEEMTENRKVMEQENFDRLVSSAEKEYEYSQKYKENLREYERVKNELNVAQEYLRLATDRNSELQAEHEKLRDAYEKLMGEKKNMEEDFKLERKKSDEAYEKEKNQMREHAEEEKEQRAGEERNNLLNRMSLQLQQERSDHERRLIEQNNVIQNLEERLAAMRSFYESKSNASHSTPSPETTPPVAIKNGRLFDSMGDELDNVSRERSNDSENDMNEQESLSDRELRRIAYKIADGNWNNIPYDIGINQRDAFQITNCLANDQEKVYRLLVCWRAQHDNSRIELLKLLSESIDSKRKDVIKFLKEMIGGPAKESGGLKTKFQKLKRSVKR